MATKKITAGLLMYRMKNGSPEILLVHPGGPYHAKKEDAVWSIPKGLTNDGEDLLETAKREFTESKKVTLRCTSSSARLRYHLSVRLKRYLRL